MDRNLFLTSEEVMKMKQTLKYIIPIILLLIILAGVAFLVNQNKDSNPSSNNITTQSDEISQNRLLDQSIAGLYASDNTDIANALSLTDQGNVKDAITALEQLVDSGNFSGDDLQALQSLLIYNYLAYGSAYYDESNSAGQARALLESSGISKETWFYNYYTAYSYEIENNFEQALVYYEQAEKNASLTTNIAKTLNQIGHVYDLQGDLGKAFSYYEQAYAKNPQDIQVNLNLGRAYTRKGDLESAKGYFEYVIENTENKILQSEIYFNLSTLALYGENGIDESIEYAKKSIEINPDYPLAYVGVARGLIKQGEASLDVKENLDKAISLYPDLATAHQYLGIYYYINEDFESAINSFTQYGASAISDITLMENQRNDNISRAQYDLARTYALNGDAANSIESLSQVMDGPNKIAFFPQFMEDFSREDSVFKGIIDTDEFQIFFKGLLDNFDQL